MSFLMRSGVYFALLFLVGVTFFPQPSHARDEVLSCTVLTTTLSRGATDLSHKGEVTALQKFLAWYYKVPQEEIVTGFYGSVTRDLVYGFQSDAGLASVGVVGPETRAKIAEFCGDRVSAQETVLAPATSRPLTNSEAGIRFENLLSVAPCVIGRDRSVSSPLNDVVCDAKVSWSAPGTQSAYVLISGDFPYNTTYFPHGFVIAPGVTGTQQPFWVTEGVYRATLYVNGDYPRGSGASMTPGTGTKVKEVLFSIGRSTTTSKVVPAAIPGELLDVTNEWAQGPALLDGFVNMYNGHIHHEAGEAYPYKMWFFGWAQYTCNDPLWATALRTKTDCDAIFYARSQNGTDWEVYSGDDSRGSPTFDRTKNVSRWKPVITAQNLYYDQEHNGDPSVVKVGNTYYMVYTASGYDRDGVPHHGVGDTDESFSGIMGAVSADGIHWDRAAKPFLISPTETGKSDTAPGNMFARPSMLYENGTFRLWFDYWVSNSFGISMGYAEMKTPATRSNFLSGTWNVLYSGNNPMLINWPNPNVIKMGDMYYSYADPVTDGRGAWNSRKVTEAVSPDGINWTVRGFVNPDTGCDAMHVPEAYVVGGVLRVTYGCQRGGSSTDSFTYKSIRTIQKGSAPVPPTPCSGGLGCTPQPEPATPTPSATCGKLLPGQSLSIGQSLTSCNGAHTATFGADGAFTFGNWSSNTGGQGGVRLTMQTDGNLVIYTSGRKAVWSLLSYVGGRMGTGQYLKLGDDGTLAVYNQTGDVRWDSRMMLKEIPTSTPTTQPTTPSATISVTTCAPGLGKSTQSPDNPLTCDITFSWNAPGATNAYAIIQGDFPYNTAYYPKGFYLGEGTTKGNTPLWVTNGTYTITLYGNGYPDTTSWKGTAQVLGTKAFTIATQQTTQGTLHQMANVLSGLEALLEKLR